MKKDFFVWWDNSSGWFEYHPENPFEAESAEEALRLAGGPFWGEIYPQVVTGSRDADPNSPKTEVLAR